MGQLANTIVVFTTDNGAEAISFPDGGVTPFKGQKGEVYEGGYRVPTLISLTWRHQTFDRLHGCLRLSRLATDLC